MKVKFLLVVVVFSFFGAGPVCAQEEAFFSPESPSTMDVISVTAPFVVGPFVETQSHSIDENEIHVVFIQDGLDLSPNPPHEATEVIGRLPAGRYTIFVELSSPGVYENTITLEMVVRAPHAIPAGNLPSAITLLALMLLIGAVAVRTRTSAR